MQDSKICDTRVLDPICLVTVASCILRAKSVTFSIREALVYVLPFGRVAYFNVPALKKPDHISLPLGFSGVDVIFQKLFLN